MEIDGWLRCNPSSRSPGSAYRYLLYLRNGYGASCRVASQAIALFRPRLIGMLGMCCGFATERCSSPRKMMDAIVAREVCCWEEGRYQDREGKQSEFKNRARVRTIDDQIRDTVSRTIEKSVDTLQPALRGLASETAYGDIRAHFGDNKVRALPDVQFAPMVSGSSVIADREMIHEILDRHPNALGLDMELYGVYCAIERSIGRKPSVLGVKGVADFGEIDKDNKAQKGASEVSAVVFKSLLPHLDIWNS